MVTRRIFLAGLGVGLVAGPGRADEARGTVADLLAGAYAALRARDQGGLRQAIDNAFDFEIWERFLLGTRGDRFTAEERGEFRNLLPGYLAFLYRDQFDKGLDRAPELGESRKARRDRLVSSVFPRTVGRDLPVDWRVRSTEQGPRIIDVMVGGTSFLLLKRDEFTAIIDRGGAGALLQHMRERAG